MSDQHREALRRVISDLYKVYGRGPNLFPWQSSDLLEYMGSCLPPGGLQEWPARNGRSNRLLRSAATRPAIARLAVAVLRIIAFMQRLWICLWRTPTPIPHSLSRAGTVDVLLSIGVANERGVRAPHDGECRVVPIDTTKAPHALLRMVLPSGSSGATAMCARAWRDLQRALRSPSVRRMHPVVRVAATLHFVDSLGAFLFTCRELDVLASGPRVRQVMGAAPSAFLMGASEWCRLRGQGSVLCFQHGLLSTSILPSVPGARHEVYGAEVAEWMREATEGRICPVRVVGLTPFPQLDFPPSKTIVLAMQGAGAFASPIGAASRPAIEALVALALEGGWRVVQRAHRMETRDPRFAVPVLAAGVEYDEGREPFSDFLSRTRAACLVTVFSTAALDAIAGGCLPVFVADPLALRAHIVDDLGRFGILLDPRSSDFEARLDSLLSRSPEHLKSEAVGLRRSIAHCMSASSASPPPRM